MNNISTKSVQHGLERKNTGKLQTMWLEIPGYCNLFCSYCYACGGERLEREKLLSWEQYESILGQAVILGVNSIGIPGAGEPLISSNLELTMKILRKCKELGLYVTLFTTAEFITADVADQLRDLPVEIMIKCNSLNPEKQDQFVSDPKRCLIRNGYGAKRNAAIKHLIHRGFNDEAQCMERFGRKSRMALVTSIMLGEDGKLDNLSDVVEILCYCRINNIIFDCDSLLERGRGTSCQLCASDQVLKNKLLELQEIDAKEFGNAWELSQSYVGTVCDRYMHHMYVSQYGEVRPCIGAMKLILGNMHSVSLEAAWNSPEMQIIRARKFSGKCGEQCANFAEGKCNSCLGRRTVNLTNENLLVKGSVETIGCWNFHKKV